MSEALAVTKPEAPVAERPAIRSSLRHLDPEVIDEAARRETRNREVHLPPVSVYRWWARRTQAVNGAVLDAIALDRPGRLTVADPFAGGGVIPLAALLRGHQVYAQDLNPWAAQGLAVMLGLPTPKELAASGKRLHAQAEATLKRAYATQFPDGEAAAISHTFRVAVSGCTACGHRHRLFPHALVSLKRRRERGLPEAFLACPGGHLFEGREDETCTCPTCARPVDPAADYTRQRLVTCPECGASERLEARAEHGAWAWEVVLVERAAGRRRELGLPTDMEIAQADGPQWQPRRTLGEIPDGQETRVLRRHGFRSWDDIYPRRQRAVLETLLDLSAEATDEARVRRALELAVIGTAEMAGQLSRWDRFYLKSYESMAGHRFNFSTFVAEPNVWGTQASGRGTVQRRLKSFAKAASWMEERGHGEPPVQGPLDGTATAQTAIPDTIDMRVVEGSSARMALPAGSVDLALTDPPYHDDVQYGELSLPLRAWAQLSTAHLAGEASVNPARADEDDEDDYQALLAGIFTEVRRTLKADGHLIFSYANRSPEAWTALFAALKEAGFRAAGYAIVHSENETDYAKRGVRACTLDFMMDLVPLSERTVEQWSPTGPAETPEVEFLTELGHTFLHLESLEDGWEQELTDRLKATSFLGAAEPAAKTATPAS